MGKRIYKIWNEETKEVFDSIVARPNSNEMKAFVEKFYKEYQEISRFYIHNNEINIIQLAEVCGHYSFAIGNSYNISKADIEKLKWEKVNSDLSGVFYKQFLDMPYYCIGEVMYAPKEAIEKVTNALKTEYKPLVIKNTNFPYWFDVEGKLFPSKEPNWFLFLYQNYNYVSRTSLENFEVKSSTKKATNS